MSGKEKIIVSMTSYPKRIKNVPRSAYFLLDKQTVKPDEIHLWLSVEEFPNKEKDLPDDLNTFIECDAIILHWVPKNTYVHKRHEYFKIAKDTDKNIHILQDLSGRKIRVSYKLKNVLKIYDRENVLFCGEDIYKKNGLQNGL